MHVNIHWIVSQSASQILSAYRISHETENVCVSETAGVGLALILLVVSRQLQVLRLAVGNTNQPCDWSKLRNSKP